MYTKSYIPYKGYYSTPFCKWQGSLANENAITLGAAVHAAGGDRHLQKEDHSGGRG